MCCCENLRGDDRGREQGRRRGLLLRGPTCRLPVLSTCNRRGSRKGGLHLRVGAERAGIGTKSGWLRAGSYLRRGCGGVAPRFSDAQKRRWITQAVSERPDLPAGESWGQLEGANVVQCGDPPCGVASS